MGKYVEVLAQELVECESKLRSVQQTMDDIYRDINLSPVDGVSLEDIDDIGVSVTYAISALEGVLKSINRKGEHE